MFDLVIQNRSLLKQLEGLVFLLLTVEHGASNTKVMNLILEINELIKP